MVGVRGSIALAPLSKSRRLISTGFRRTHKRAGAAGKHGQILPISVEWFKKSGGRSEFTGPLGNTPIRFNPYANEINQWSHENNFFLFQQFLKLVGNDEIPPQIARL